MDTVYILVKCYANGSRSVLAVYSNRDAAQIDADKWNLAYGDAADRLGLDDHVVVQVHPYMVHDEPFRE